MFHRDSDQLAARAHHGLGKQLLHRVFDRAFGNIQAGRDFLVYQALHQETKHIHLSFIQGDTPGLGTQYDPVMAIRARPLLLLREGGLLKRLPQCLNDYRMDDRGKPQRQVVVVP